VVFLFDSDSFRTHDLRRYLGAGLDSEASQMSPKVHPDG